MASRMRQTPLREAPTSGRRAEKSQPRVVPPTAPSASCVGRPAASNSVCTAWESRSAEPRWVPIITKLSAYSVCRKGLGEGAGFRSRRKFSSCTSGTRPAMDSSTSWQMYRACDQPMGIAVKTGWTSSPAEQATPLTAVTSSSPHRTAGSPKYSCSSAGRPMA